MSRITVYTTEPCGYCRVAKALLAKRNVPYEEINLAKDPEGRAELVRVTGMMTFPQVVIDGEPIGGADALAFLDRRGVLLPRLRRDRFPVAVGRRPSWLARLFASGGSPSCRLRVELLDRDGRLLGTEVR